jgi:hypothetical protein
MATRSNAAKTRGMSGDKNRKARGRTNITGMGGDLGPKKTNPLSTQERRSDVTRPVSPGGGNKHRGDRRDMNKLYTNNAKHSSRGNNPRPDVSTRKR